MISRRLEMFLLVAERGSFSKAAEALYLSPVSVKKQIDSLEAEVGVTLFERTNQGTALTPAGKAFLAEARKIPALSQRAIARAREAAAPARARIRLGTSLIRPCIPLTDFWWRMGGGDLPFDLQIVPFEEDGETMGNVVGALGRDIDCFVAPCDSAYWRDTCSILTLAQMPLCIGLPHSHPLASRECLTWEDLEGQTIMLPQGNDFSVIPALQREIHDAHPGVHVQRTDPHTTADVFNRCAQGEGLMASYAIWENVHPMVTVRPVAWDYAVPYGIIYATRPSEAMAAFASAVSDGLQRLGWT